MRKKTNDLKDILYGRLKERISFAMEMRASRTLRDLTQEEMAKKLGVSKQYLSDIENKRRFVSVEKAAEYARKLKESERFYVMLALQDMINNCGLKYKVDVA
jgi:transcriptional regulator with XRE-family HTH domain